VLGPFSLHWEPRQASSGSQQELQNLVQQDPLADLLGPMQKLAPKPMPASGL
jgi:hypothetical protein